MASLGLPRHESLNNQILFFVFITYGKQNNKQINNKYDILSLVVRALHKLLEIFQNVSRNFSKVAFCNETCPKVAGRNKNFFGLMLKYANCTTTVQFLSMFVQFCGVTSNDK